MSRSYCPSMDWDRHIDRLDEEADFLISLCEKCQFEPVCRIGEGTWLDEQNCLVLDEAIEKNNQEMREHEDYFFEKEKEYARERQEEEDLAKDLEEY